jgi:hypothetical protein
MSAGARGRKTLNMGRIINPIGAFRTENEAAETQNGRRCVRLPFGSIGRLEVELQAELKLPGSLRTCDLSKDRTSRIE